MPVSLELCTLLRRAGFYTCSFLETSNKVTFFVEPTNHAIRVLGQSHRPGSLSDGWIHLRKSPIVLGPIE